DEPRGRSGRLGWDLRAEVPAPGEGGARRPGRALRGPRAGASACGRRCRTGTRVPAPARGRRYRWRSEDVSDFLRGGARRGGRRERKGCISRYTIFIIVVEN